MRYMLDLHARVRFLCASGLVCAAMAGSSLAVAQDTEWTCYPPSRFSYCNTPTQALAACCVSYSACAERVEDLNQSNPGHNFVCAGGSALNCESSETALCYDL
jgi:hypothetical protein